MQEAVREPGDSLFVTWNINWIIRALLTDPLNIFHANIFYPYKYTLAYSEHMIGVGLLALPVSLFTKNPLLIYNIMLLFSFVLCGWGGYLLSYYLTRDRIAGIISGIIFAFCPFRFAQFGHLHVLTSQWMLFSLFFLHRYIDVRPRRFQYLFLFGLFFFLQAISSGHNGLYLSLTIGLFLVYFWKEAGIFPWIAVFTACVLLIPFYYPNMHLAGEFGFTRPMHEFELYSPQLSSYLAVPNGNFLYGGLFSRFGGPEAVMFPGILVLVLSLWRRMPRIKIRFGLSLLNIFILLDIILIILIIKTGGIDLGWSILGVKLKISDLTRPMTILIVLLLLKTGRRRLVNFFKKIFSNRGVTQFYWILAVLSFLFTFGPEIRFMDKEALWGPYSLLYNYFPGFKGLRVSGRIYVLFIMAMAVLAGFGIKRLRTTRCRYLVFLIPFLVTAEYINVPFTLNCRIGKNSASVYKQLKGLKEDAVIIELPMPDWYSLFSHEIEYLYWSVFHWKRLVNGYSGYSPPPYWVIAEKMKYFPTEDTVEMLKVLDVDYVIVHNAELKRWGWPDVTGRMEGYKDVLSLSFSDGNDYIYELVDRTSSIPAEIPYVAIDKAGLKIKVNYNIKDVNKAIDNDMSTRWHSDAKQKKGMYLEIDTSGLYEIGAVSMDFGRASMDFPREIKLEVSENKAVWREVDLRFIYANYVKHLLEYPKDKRMIIRFKPLKARFLRLTLTSDHGVFFWSVYELDVFTTETLKI